MGVCDGTPTAHVEGVDANTLSQETPFDSLIVLSYEGVLL